MVLGFLPADYFDLSDIQRARAGFAAFAKTFPNPPLPAGMSVQDVTVPGHQSTDPDVLVRLYRPKGQKPVSGALLWIHGGGMVLGEVGMNDQLCAMRAEELGCLVASVDYRLAPEHPYPAQLHDCYAALSWLAANSPDVGIDPAAIAVGGSSSGGGLATGLTMMARDQGGPAIIFQLLVYPMLDHRNQTRTSGLVQDTRVWNQAANVAAWAAYLGQTTDVSPYAAPAIAEVGDLIGLPPAYINVGEFDIFVDENVSYAQALMSAGVSTELHVYRGAFHASDMLVADSPVSKRWRADEMAALRAVLVG